jgi:hypothetical protein
MSYQRNRTIDVTMLVWTLIMGFAVDGEARTIAGFQRAYPQQPTKPLPARASTIGSHQHLQHC